MADALAAFQAVAPAGETRLYVLGCMVELGPESPALHRALGRALNLRGGDRMIVIGQQANEVCAGVLEQGDFTRQIQIASTIDTIAAEVAAWHGAVFLKGSRRYQLERAIAPAGAEVAHA